MRCVIKRPGEPAFVSDTTATLAALQALVGGYIEAVHAGRATVYVNEDGIARRLAFNCAVGVHAIYGTLVVLGLADNGGDDTGLTAAAAAKWVGRLNAQPQIAMVRRAPARHMPRP